MSALLLVTDKESYQYEAFLLAIKNVNNDKYQNAKIPFYFKVTDNNLSALVEYDEFHNGVLLNIVKGDSTVSGDVIHALHKSGVKNVYIPKHNVQYIYDDMRNIKRVDFGETINYVKD